MLSQQLTREDNRLIDDFVQHCYEGNIDTAMSTYAEMKDNIRYTYAKNGRPFQMACFGGHLHIAKWIHQSIHSEKILPEYYNEAFYLACSGGHLDIVEWLYSLGCIDICKHNSRAFSRANCNKHTHILQFFISLDKRFYPLCKDSL